MFTLARYIVLKGAFAALVMGVNVASAQVVDIEKECTTLSAPGTYPDYGTVPSYSIVRHEHDKAGVLVLRISMSIEEFNGGAILRLGCKLISGYPQEQAVEALIFDDTKAASKFAPGFTDQQHYGTYLWHLKGHFALNKKTGSAFIEFLIPNLHDGLPDFRRIRYRLVPSK